MSLQIIKTLIPGAIALMVSYTSIEAGLRLLLLIVTIGYTAFKWYEAYKKR